MRASVLALSYLIVFAVGIGAAIMWFPDLTATGHALLPALVSPSPTLAPFDTNSTVSATVPILAVRSDNNEGVLGSATVEISPGRGRVLINTNPFVEPDTQYSMETAVATASQFTGKSVADRDIVYTFQSGSQLVGGPSAGGAMTVATIAALSGRKVRDDVAMTGTIEANGKIGWIGGVIQKAEAAAKAGKKTFLVPKGQEVMNYYEQKLAQKQMGSFVVSQVYYVPHELDLNNYTMSQWGMAVKPVADIQEAAAAMLAG